MMFLSKLQRCSIDKAFGNVTYYPRIAPFAIVLLLAAATPATDEEEADEP
jgi:hypothetical protein